MTHQRIDNSSHMFDAMQFIRSMHHSYGVTTIEHNTSDLQSDTAISKAIVTLDHIERSGYLGNSEKELFRLAKYHSDYNVKDRDLVRELQFLFQLVNEVKYIIDRTVVKDADNTKLSIILSGLKQIADSISFGDAGLMDGSGRGISVAVIELLLHRLDYHGIYRGFTNSTPLAKYFVITHAIHRSTRCQLQPNWKN